MAGAAGPASAIGLTGFAAAGGDMASASAGSAVPAGALFVTPLRPWGACGAAAMPGGGGRVSVLSFAD
jgi:hypothetical protein